MIYLDTSYLVRLYLEDRGYEQVRDLARTDRVASAWLGRIETLTAFHRALRERRLSQDAYRLSVEQFLEDCVQGGFVWFPLAPELGDRIERVLREAPSSVFLRTADALHLACAAEHGLLVVYSNDRHLLAAAPLFGLRGVNVIPDA